MGVCLNLKDVLYQWTNFHEMYICIYIRAVELCVQLLERGKKERGREMSVSAGKRKEKRKEGGEGHLYITRECQVFNSYQETFVNDWNAEYIHEHRAREANADFQSQSLSRMHVSCNEEFTAPGLHST